MIQNLNYMYSSLDSNSKCVSSTIKYIGFEPIYYTINLNVVSSYMILSDFNLMFLSMYY